MFFSSRLNRASCRYIGKYLLGNDIGRGSFGTVKLAKHKVNGTIVAIKRINDVDDARTRKLVDLEIEMQGRLKHPLIAELYEVMKVDKMVFMVRTEHSSESRNLPVLTMAALRRSWNTAQAGPSLTSWWPREASQRAEHDRCSARS
eukprot:COSAG04_NODE_1346_length_7137_cov_620.694231_4_plen_146_part_00